MAQNDRTAELKKLIVRYQKSYYTGEAEISDAEFDALWDELKRLDPQNPLLHKIGSDVSEDYSLFDEFATVESAAGLAAAPQGAAGGVFEKVRHVIPMGSQEKAANDSEFEQWAAKMTFDEFLVEYKLDGASLELQYENGVFVRAVTRGDGVVGDDISRNVLKMQGLVKNLNGSFTGGVRGEVIMTKRVHKDFYADKANCRNAANGLMKRKDGEGCEHLRIICYDARFASNRLADQPFADEEEKVKWLALQGFYTVPLHVCRGVQKVIEYRLQVMEQRAQLDYDIDGLVVKGRVIDFADAERDRPEKQIAFKFSLEEAVSVLRSVVWSESGATYTPIAEFDTVELAGTKVQRASLVNPNTIRSLAVKIGSHIVVTKRGEIIPKIERVLERAAAKTGTLTDLCARDVESVQTPVEFPRVCAVCGTLLTDEGTRLFCPNTACPKRIHHRIEKWVSVLDIRDLGTTLIKRLFETKRLTAISDIYTLTVDELAQLDGLGQKSAEKIVASIKSRTRVSLETFIAGFDIEGIGETLMEKLTAAGFNTLDKLFCARETDIASVYGFGDITAHTLVQGLAECRTQMYFLTENGIITIEAPLTAQENPLVGKSFCFTGELYSLKRSEAEALVKQAGGNVKSSVVKGLSYLVTNDTSSGSSKNKKAVEQGTPVIDEKTFLAMVRRM
ncbi:NAD-dependent DNA ligase LigA [Treponema lecithinolyticum]|uniref:DNA ligase n=1 Tax=Treponema lecithinolyticum ATCC 700332 TaxID=1321815 RepID=A0ABN0NX01_TRELE|nr:NAD-dependent DNA ligase LigA [Treponema lecithinolyticum]ERJ91950.1 DNA ligase [Treponema lecithinolyticum ATCC 700332]